MRKRNENAFPYGAQVLERSFAILDVLANSQVDLTLAEMRERLDLHQSTFYRLLRTLEHYRFAERDPNSGKYRLGSRLLELGSRTEMRSDLATVGRPYLVKLSEESGETAHLGVLIDHEVISIAVVEGRHALRMSVTVGGKSPFHCTSLGKAILALLPDEEVSMVLDRYGLRPMTKRTITRRSRLRTELTQIRTVGYALDNEELEEGLKCIGAAVQNYSGRVVGAISVAGAAHRFSAKRQAYLAPVVARVASEFSASLGFRPGGALPKIGGIRGPVNSPG